MLLGIYSDPELVDQRLELLPGDSLVLFTDGLAERRDPRDDPRGRIRELLRASAGASASETAARLGQLALTDNGKPDDDVAVVVLRRVGLREHGGGPGARANPCGRAEPSRGPADARAALSPLAGALPARVYSDLRLQVSELVTNSVRHAQLRPGDLIRLQVEVSDRAPSCRGERSGAGVQRQYPGPGRRGSRADGGSS